MVGKKAYDQSQSHFQLVHKSFHIHMSYSLIQIHCIDDKREQIAQEHSSLHELHVTLLLVLKNGMCVCVCQSVNVFNT